MRDQQQRPSLAAPLDPRDEVLPLGIGAEQLAWNLMRVGDLFQIFGDTRFIAGRIGSVQAHQVRQILTGSFSKRPVIVGSHPETASTTTKALARRI